MEGEVQEVGDIFHWLRHRLPDCHIHTSRITLYFEIFPKSREASAISMLSISYSLTLEESSVPTFFALAVTVKTNVKFPITLLAS